MTATPILKVSYFPGCSLATSAAESNQSMMEACQVVGLELEELPDWNCCGSSSAHSLDLELALGLAARNLAQAPPDRPLMVMCPACYKNLRRAHLHLIADPERRRFEERRWGGEISPDLKIITFLDILAFLDRLRHMGAVRLPTWKNPLKGLKVAPYFGCAAMFPKAERPPRYDPRLMERILHAMGAEVLTWAYPHRCCGTFLSVIRPDVTTPLVNQIISAAKAAGADCLVTACAMCQLNLEIRCNLAEPIPILHFSEALALALGAQDYEGWFKRHLVDPRPMLRQRQLIA